MARLALALLLLATVARPGQALAQPCRDPACAIAFPPDAGAIDVRGFGAKGDGRTDDTAALLAAIAASGADAGASFWRNRLIYLPPGTYLVSATLAKRDAAGRFASGMALIGAGVDATTIRLRDAAPGFTDPASPRAVVLTASGLLDPAGATGGGKDWRRLGEGNDAYENFVENLTIDAGAGNPGAIGIDFLASNIGAVRDVAVVAAAASGATGIAMTRKWPGPALLERVSVTGFEVGIDLAQSEYGITAEHVRLRGQRSVAVRNRGNLLAARDLDAEGPGTALANLAAGGLVVLQDGRLAGTTDNRGGLVQPAGPAWTLPVAEPPRPPPDPPSSWVRAAPPSDGGDATGILRRAFASGAATVYLASASYPISEPIEVPPSLRRIVGMNATITPARRRPAFRQVDGMLRIARAGPPLIIERVAFDSTGQGDQVAVDLAAARDLVLRDVVGAGGILLDRRAAGGRAFIEDTCCARLRLAGAAPVFARQLDTEGGDGRARIEADGTPLWVLGLKTEGRCTAIAASAGARVEVAGGLLYRVTEGDDDIPAFRATDAWLQASYVEESLRPTSRYRIHLAQSWHGEVRTVLASSLPARGFGRMVLSLTAGPP